MCPAGILQQIARAQTAIMPSPDPMMNRGTKSGVLFDGGEDAGAYRRGRRIL
jgi:hypothetical protein